MQYVLKILLLRIMSFFWCVWVLLVSTYASTNRGVYTKNYVVIL